MTADAHHTEEHHEHPNYVRIWIWLVILLVISICGPFLGIPIVTIMTAFGIAVVKAYMVARNFMHLNIERRYVIYIVSTMLIFMFLFFTFVAPDVMKHDGDNWVKPDAANWAAEAAAEAEHH